MRHLHDKVAVLDERTAPKKEDPAAEAAAAAAVMGGGLMGLGDTLMIGNGGYGAAGGYADPYAGGYGGGYGAPAGGNPYGGYAPSGYY